MTPVVERFAFTTGQARIASNPHPTSPLKKGEESFLILPLFQGGGLLTRYKTPALPMAIGRAGAV